MDVPYTRDDIPSGIEVEAVEVHLNPETVRLGFQAYKGIEGGEIRRIRCYGKGSGMQSPVDVGVPEPEIRKVRASGTGRQVQFYASVGLPESKALGNNPAQPADIRGDQSLDAEQGVIAEQIVCRAAKIHVNTVHGCLESMYVGSQHSPCGEFHVDIGLEVEGGTVRQILRMGLRNTHAGAEFRQAAATETPFRGEIRREDGIRTERRSIRVEPGGVVVQHILEPALHERERRIHVGISVAEKDAAVEEEGHACQVDRKAGCGNAQTVGQERICQLSVKVERHCHTAEVGGGEVCARLSRKREAAASGLLHAKLRKGVVEGVGTRNEPGLKGIDGQGYTRHSRSPPARSYAAGKPHTSGAHTDRHGRGKVIEHQQAVGAEAELPDIDSRELRTDRIRPVFRIFRQCKHIPVHGK